jgi:hypothetical protein
MTRCRKGKKMSDQWTEAEWIVDQALASHRIPIDGDRVKLPREICDALKKAGLLQEKKGD